MADVLMTAGDDFEHPMTLQDDDGVMAVGVAIPLSATVLAALVDDEDIVLISATTVSSSTAGSDWATGKIVVKFTNAQTGAISNLPKLARIHVQIETVTGKKTTYRSDWFVIEADAIV